MSAGGSSTTTTGSPAPLRVAVVGAAGTWGRYYLGAYHEHPDVEVVALVDPALPRTRALAARFGVVRVCTTVDELLAPGHGPAPDIVSVVVPVGQNVPVVSACAHAGVDVVSCEKPIHWSLEQADALVELCRAKGTRFACGQCAWAVPFMPEIFDWVAAGNIGKVTSASIPGGLPTEVSGGGCPQLAAIRLLVGQEATWVEGWTDPCEPTYDVLPQPSDATLTAADLESSSITPAPQPHEADCTAWGRIGFANGAVCTIPPPPDHTAISHDSAAGPRDRPAGPLPNLSAEGTHGRVWLGNPQPVLVQGTGATAGPVYPPFLETAAPTTADGGFNMFAGTVQRLVDCAKQAREERLQGDGGGGGSGDTMNEPLSSGHDYRQALELAIALKLSAQQGTQSNPAQIQLCHSILPCRCAAAAAATGG